MGKGRNKMPMGMGGNMAGMMKQVQKMQEDMERIKKEIDETIFEGSSASGGIVAKVSGEKVLKQITIDPELLVPEDSEIISDMIVIAVNEAIKKAEDTSNEKLGALTGGLNIPGL